MLITNLHVRHSYECHNDCNFVKSKCLLCPCVYVIGFTFQIIILRFTLCLVVKVSYLDNTTKNPELFTKEAPAGLWTQILILESLTSKKRHKQNRVSWATRIPRKLLFSYLDKLFLELCSLILIQNIHFGTLTSPEIYVLHTHL